MRNIATLRRGGLNLKPSASGPAYGPIRNAVIPSIAVFPCLQHSGSPAECQVAPGDRVREGMLIAKASGEISASVHASVPGIVTALRPIRLPNGEVSDAITIRLEGGFERLGRSPASPVAVAPSSGEVLLAKLGEAGVVSLDVASVPIHVLWRLPRGKHVESLIVSAVVDEPYLSVEQCLAVERTTALLEGLKIAIAVLKPRSIVFVSEPTPSDGRGTTSVAIENAAGAAGLTFAHVAAGPHYPRGGQRELVRTATGREVPAGSSPLSVGAVVTNVSTLIAVRDAIHADRPLIERYVTVAGDAVVAPATLRVRIGTRVRDVIEECGGFNGLPDRIVVGGPLTGSSVYDLDTPITKNTRAVLVLSKRETGGGRRGPCIACGRCLTSCPENLNPSKLFKDIDHGRFENAVAAGLMDCTECGSCSFVCPSNIPLLEGIRAGKIHAPGNVR